MLNIDLSEIVHDTRACIITGSSVLNTRYCKDIDVICYKDNIKIPYTSTDDYIISITYNNKRYEFLLADNDKSLQNILNKVYTHSLDELEVLYILKKGHIVVPGKNLQNWMKHMTDLHNLSNIFNDNYRSTFEQDWKLHRKSTIERVKLRTPKLKGVSREEFFDDNVTKHYIHDNCHRAIAYTDKPIYEKMQKDDTVECHEDLWNLMTDKEKCQCISEEASVIALERHIIPTLMGSKIGLSLFEAYKHSLMRICTTLCSGFFREYAIDNFFTILNMYRSDLVEIFEKNIVKYEPLKHNISAKETSTLY